MPATQTYSLGIAEWKENTRAVFKENNLKKKCMERWKVKGWDNITLLKEPNKL